MGGGISFGQSGFPKYQRLLERKPVLGGTRGPRPLRLSDVRRWKGQFRNRVQTAWTGILPDKVLH